MSVSPMDVFKVMIERNMPEIKMASLNNISNMAKVKAGTKVTIGVAGDVINPILNGDLCGGLILADAKTFRQIKQELEAAESQSGTQPIDVSK
jgi:hypothetical protein